MNACILAENQMGHGFNGEMMCDPEVRPPHMLRPDVNHQMNRTLDICPKRG
jgi:hypothetical protein